VVSSVGMKSFNLLGPSSSSIAGMSSLGYVISFFSVFGAEISYFCFNSGYL